MGNPRLSLDRVLTSLFNIVTAVRARDDQYASSSLAELTEQASRKISKGKENLLALATLALEGRYAPRARPLPPPENMQDRAEYERQLEQYTTDRSQWREWQKGCAAIGGARLILSDVLRETRISDAPGSLEKLNKFDMGGWSVCELLKLGALTHGELAAYINRHSSTLGIHYTGPKGERITGNEWILVSKQAPLDLQSASPPAPDRP